MKALMKRETIICIIGVIVILIYAKYAKIEEQSRRKELWESYLTSCEQSIQNENEALKMTKLMYDEKQGIGYFRIEVTKLNSLDKILAKEIVSDYEVGFEEGLKAGNIVMENYETIDDTTVVLNYVCFTRGVKYGGGNEKLLVRCQKEDIGTFQLMDTACGRTFYSKWKQEITVTPMKLQLERRADEDLELVVYFKDGSSTEVLIEDGASSLSFVGDLLFVNTMDFIDVDTIAYIVYEGLKYQ